MTLCGVMSNQEREVESNQLQGDMLTTRASWETEAEESLEVRGFRPV